MPGPIVETADSVTLRTFEDDDVAFYQRSCTDPEIRYALGTPTPKSESELESWLDGRDESGEHDGFIVCLDGDGAPAGHPDPEEITRIGAVVLIDTDEPRAGLAYWLLPEYWGEGYATEAVRTVVDYAFRTYPVRGVGAVAYDFNEASRGLLEKLGFAEEGRIREVQFVAGEYRDAVEYGVLREEWTDG